MLLNFEFFEDDHVSFGHRKACYSYWLNFILDVLIGISIKKIKKHSATNYYIKT